MAKSFIYKRVRPAEHIHVPYNKTYYYYIIVHDRSVFVFWSATLNENSQ